MLLRTRNVYTIKARRLETITPPWCVFPDLSICLFQIYPFRKDIITEFALVKNLHVWRSTSNHTQQCRQRQDVSYNFEALISTL